MRIVETFHVRRPCAVVFDYLTDPSKLDPARWRAPLIFDGGRGLRELASRS